MTNGLNEIRLMNTEMRDYQKRAFAEWLDQHLVKAMISMIPAGPHPEHVKVILEAAFEAGAAAGAASLAVSVMSRKSTTET